jgi:hypothetical protein
MLFKNVPGTKETKGIPGYTVLCSLDLVEPKIQSIDDTLKVTPQQQVVCHHHVQLYTKAATLPAIPTSS